ncbi:MAG: ketosteroid isomerase family protein [Crocosphaera sp.]|nr:ketosteroid isomerase family protein [Crocosphaera sp.]
MLPKGLKFVTILNGKLKHGDHRVETIDITKPVIKQYFETLNRGDFQGTANLFAPEGVLNPPFESPVVGSQAIAAYLQQEAIQMTLYPFKETVETKESGEIEAKIKGKVKTALFSVNVAWTFLLDQNQRIISVTVTLLASLEELVSLKR